MWCRYSTAGAKHGGLITDDVNTISVISLFRTNCPAFSQTSSLLLMHVVEAYAYIIYLYTSTRPTGFHLFHLFLVLIAVMRTLFLGYRVKSLTLGAHAQRGLQ